MLQRIFGGTHHQAARMAVPEHMANFVRAMQQVYQFPEVVDDK